MPQIDQKTIVLVVKKSPWACGIVEVYQGEYAKKEAELQCKHLRKHDRRKEYKYVTMSIGAFGAEKYNLGSANAEYEAATGY